MITKEDKENYFDIYKSVKGTVDYSDEELLTSGLYTELEGRKLYPLYWLIGIHINYWRGLYSDHQVIHSEELGSIGKDISGQTVIDFLDHYIDNLPIITVDTMEGRVEDFYMGKPPYEDGNYCKNIKKNELDAVKRQYREIGKGVFKIADYFCGKEQAYKLVKRHQEEYFKELGDIYDLGLNNAEIVIQKLLFNLEIRLMKKGVKFGKEI